MQILQRAPARSISPCAAAHCLLVPSQLRRSASVRPIGYLRGRPRVPEGLGPPATLTESTASLRSLRARSPAEDCARIDALGAFARRFRAAIAGRLSDNSLEISGCLAIRPVTRRCSAFAPAILLRLVIADISAWVGRRGSVTAALSGPDMFSTEAVSNDDSGRSITIRKDLAIGKVCRQPTILRKNEVPDRREVNP